MFHPRRLVSLLAIALTLGASPALAAPRAPGPRPGLGPVSAAVRDWRDEVVYFALTDRFYNGDRRNDRGVDPKRPTAYHGGDFEGLRQKLDYLAGLGVSALWISPVNDNQDRPLSGRHAGYHGYWIQDFQKVDEHWGDEAALKRLVREAHARGLKVILDMVVNHMGYDAPMASDPWYRDWFHHNGRITDYEDPYQAENHDLAGLPDFNTENAQVLQFMSSVWSGWIARTGIDGFRADAVKHVPVPFWQRFNRALKERSGPGFLMLGEVFSSQPERLVPYLREGGFSGALDFPMNETLRAVFASGRSMRLLGERLGEDARYPAHAVLAPFLDNHDMARFLTAAQGDRQKLYLALAALMSMRGMPVLYYGTELAMSGGADPENRQDMAWGTNPEWRERVARLVKVRRELAPLRRGSTHTMVLDADLYGFSRRLGPQEVLVFWHKGDRARVLSLALPPGSPLKDGVILDRLSGQRHRVARGLLNLVVPDRSAMILAP